MRLFALGLIVCLGLLSRIAPARPDTIGVYFQGVFYLRSSNTTGQADLIIPFGAPGFFPVVGDWTGSGIDTIGVYDPMLGVFMLRDSNTPGPPDHAFVFGDPGDRPLAGRWDATMTHDGIGVYRPTNGVIYLKRELSSGYADYAMTLGRPNDLAVAGDWDGDGLSSIGIFVPATTTFYLSDSVGDGAMMPDYEFNYGTPGSIPFAGDWNGIGQSRIGVLDGDRVSLRNNLTTGTANLTFTFGEPGALPVAGHWTDARKPSP